MAILFDSDFILSLFIKEQAYHQPAIKILNRVMEDDFYILNLTKYEVITVASRKFAHTLALDILDLISQFKIKKFTEEDEGKTLELFKGLKKKNISFIDCANLVAAKEHKLKIASFDKFYPKELRLSL